MENISYEYVVAIGNHVPTAIVRALKMTKSSHKFEAQSMRQGAQSIFFSNFWERINSDFNGVDKASRKQVFEKVSLIVDQSAMKCTKATASPNLAPCDECKHQQSEAAFSDEDFELALHLLKLPCTPNCTEIFKGAPNVDITPAPIYGDDL